MVRKHKGFTLESVIIAMVIFSILSAMGIAGYTQHVKHANIENTTSQLTVYGKNLEDAVDNIGFLQWKQSDNTDLVKSKAADYLKELEDVYFTCRFDYSTLQISDFESSHYGLSISTAPQKDAWGGVYQFYYILTTGSGEPDRALFCSAGPDSTWATEPDNKAYLAGSYDDDIVNLLTIKTSGEFIGASVNTSASTYTVSFNADGGSGTMAASTVEKGQAYTLPACSFTAPDGKQFASWSINGENHAAGSSVTVRANLTAKAVWKDKSENPAAPNKTDYDDPANAGRSFTASADTTGKDFENWLDSLMTKMPDGTSATIQFKDAPAISDATYTGTIYKASSSDAAVSGRTTSGQSVVKTKTGGTWNAAKFDYPTSDANGNTALPGNLSVIGNLDLQGNLNALNGTIAAKGIKAPLMIQAYVSGSVLDYALTMANGLTTFATQSSTTDLPTGTNDFTYSVGTVFRRQGNQCTVTLHNDTENLIATNTYISNNWSGWSVTGTINTILTDEQKTHLAAIQKIYAHLPNHCVITAYIEGGPYSSNATATISKTDRDYGYVSILSYDASQNTNYTIYGGNWANTTPVTIVESGTSGIWTYKKYSDGTCECWGNWNGPLTSYGYDAKYGYFYYTQLDLPFTFAKEPTYTYTARVGDGGAIPAFINASTTKVVPYAASPTYGGTQTCYFDIIVKGRWK